MSSSVPFYSAPVPQDLAVKMSTNGLCGDSSHHNAKRAIAECTVPKRVVVFKDDAQYSLVHLDSSPVDAASRTRLCMQAATLQSRRFLVDNDARERAYGLDAGIRRVDQAVPTSTGRFKTSSTPTPAPPGSKVHDSPVPAASHAHHIGGTGKAKSISKPAAATPVQSKALAHMSTVDLRASIEETLQWFLDQNPVHFAKDNGTSTITSTSAPKKPAATGHHVTPPSAVTTVVPGQVPVESSDASKVKIEPAMKDMAQDLSTTTVSTLEPEVETEDCHSKDEDDWEVVDRPTEEARAKASFGGRLAGRFFGSRLR
ncbi:hypothetical protein LTR12_013572 [Friedmanniomyces endolithicus]|nr:hypothetical protein LTR74_016893 [Friedmanniomyces endolithicus]KAK1812069.1 hypothetical protein LTR12_013572 [Friedmanniomyces endolithicus]